MTRSSLIAVITFSSVAFSVLISIVWFFEVSGASRFAPTVHIFGLLGGLTGVLVGRRVSAREGRHLALVNLIDELRRNVFILDDPEYAPSEGTPRPRVYRRLLVSATNAALTLGTLAERSDDELLRRLHGWRDDVNGFNRRLELTEFHGFIYQKPAEIAKLERALHGGDGYLNQIRRDLPELLNYLVDNYPVASEHYEKSGGSGGPRGTALGLRNQVKAGGTATITWLRLRRPVARSS